MLAFRVASNMVSKMHDAEDIEEHINTALRGDDPVDDLEMAKDIGIGVLIGFVVSVVLAGVVYIVRIM